jgi:homocysteine S-methyltransferase
MNNEVPGVNVPDAILERMRRAETKDQARIEGVAIAREALQALLPYVQGAQISAPFGRYQTALEVAQAIPTERRTSDIPVSDPDRPSRGGSPK